MSHGKRMAGGRGSTGVPQGTPPFPGPADPRIVAGMIEFLASVGPFGWAVIAALLIGLATLPRAVREAWNRPWKDIRRDPRAPGPPVGGTRGGQDGGRVEDRGAGEDGGGD